MSNVTFRQSMVSELNMHESIVNGAIRSGDAASVARFMDSYCMRLAGDLRVDIRRSLAHPDMAVRIGSACRTCVWICHGADPANGMPLSMALLAFLRENWRTLAFQSPDLLQVICATALNSAVYVHYIEGKWETCRALVYGARADFPFIHQLPVFWNATGTAALTLLKSNRPDDAARLMESAANANSPAPVVPEAPIAASFRQRYLTRQERTTCHPQAPQLKEAHEAYTTIEAFYQQHQQRFNVETARPTDRQIAEILDAQFKENIAILGALNENLRQQPASIVVGLERSRLEGSEQKLRNLQNLANDPQLAFSEKQAILALEHLRWREDLTHILSPLQDWNHVNGDWVGLAREKAFALINASSNAEAEADVIASLLEKAHDWCVQAGDEQGVWMVDWARLVLAEKRGLPAQCNAHLIVICDNLLRARAKVGDIESSSNVSNFFPGLAGKACAIHARHGDIVSLMTALELRKSRSLVACAADLQLGDAGRQLYEQPAALGAATHYLSYTVIEKEDRIQAMLYTSDGRLTTERLNMPIATVKCFETRIAPSSRVTDFFRSDARPVAVALDPLLSPLRAAVDQGRIRFGDHVCIAADDPVNLIPLHMLLIEGRPAVAHLSMSRVASFRDAVRLANEEATRPDALHALLVPSVERTPGSRRPAFLSMAKSAGRWLKNPEVVDGVLVTRDRLLERLLPHRLIHIHGHGQFKRCARPDISSGILVSDGIHLPHINGTAPLLSPQDILTAFPDLHGSHVTLGACVSGKGIEGMGGDIVGMEMALRLCGAASVLATHWEVDSNHAALFAEQFYQAWLGDRKRRGQAWRDTMNLLMAQENDAVGMAECCNYTLFGSWR